MSKITNFFSLNISEPDEFSDWPLLTSRVPRFDFSAVTFASYTDKKENIIFLIYKEFQSGAVAKSYCI
jgi:hypothetical protein